MVSDQILKMDRVRAIVQMKGMRLICLCLIYSMIILVSIWLSYQLRFDFYVDALPRELEHKDKFFLVVLWVIPVKLFVLLGFGQYSGLLGYFATPDLMRLARATCAGSAILGIVRLQAAGSFVPPRGVILIDFVLVFLLFAGFRTGCRLLRELMNGPRAGEERATALRIGIIGAGDVGASLAKELLIKRGLGRIPIAFFDDDKAKQGTRIHNVPVVGSPDQIGDLDDRLKIDEAIIAMPSASARRLNDIVGLLQRHHKKFVTVPSLDQLATGKVRISQLRPVEIQDLLGRESVLVERESIGRMVSGHVILVTGAGGSIGRELCRQLSGFNPEKLLMIDHSEFLLFEIEQELIDSGYGGIIRPLVGSILDEKRIEGIISLHLPDVIFHAAAMKHVPMMEAQASEAIKVNILGTRNLAVLATKHKVPRFVMISTDKAINPTSVMGATKRLAEIFIQALFAEQKEGGTSFMAVRFGNVLGSSGSVIPTFKRQIEAGGPVKVTHPDVTRYFMTIPEAVGLVLQCGTQGAGGEIFVLDMGKPVKILDLAKQLIRLSGLRPDEDIEIELSGLRPGEKLYEELQHKGENTAETEHGKIMKFICEPCSMEEIEDVIDKLRESVDTVSNSDLKELLNFAVPEYRPYI
jgi:FlaA1/EpsC-like NDP-sugar epimerase